MNMPTQSLGAINTLPLHRMQEAIKVLQASTGNEELQAQAMLVFLFVASRHPGETSLGEVEKALSLNQTTASRNLGYLAKGNAKLPKGWQLVDTFEDPFYRRRKLCKLTKKGWDCAVRIAEALTR
jgi:DNA-binding MarR family transcriptional regulator